MRHGERVARKHYRRYPRRWPNAADSFAAQATREVNRSHSCGDSFNLAVPWMIVDSCHSDTLPASAWRTPFSYGRLRGWRPAAFSSRRRPRAGWRHGADTVRHQLQRSSDELDFAAFHGSLPSGISSAKSLLPSQHAGAAQDEAQGVRLARLFLSNAFKRNAEFLRHSRGGTDGGAGAAAGVGGMACRLRGMSVANVRASRSGKS